MGFTNAQNAAIHESGRTVLVSAAAGSGKTFTLTERIIHRILNENADIQRMLIVTFTRAAAGELKSRITAALSDRISQHPDDERLQNQMLLMSSAKICTIDSFFTDPVRSNFDKLGLTANVRLADQPELYDIKMRAFNDTLERMFDANGIKSGMHLSDIKERNEFTDLIYLLTNSRSTGKLTEILSHLYNKLLSTPLGIDTLKHQSEQLLELSDKDFFETHIGEIIRENIISKLELELGVFEYCVRRIEEDELAKSKYTFNMCESRDMCQSLIYRISNCRFSDIAKAFEAYSPSKLVSVRGATPLMEECKKKRQEANKHINDLRKKYTSISSEDIKNEFIQASELNRILYDILSDLDKSYCEAKRERGLFEFSDMPRFLMQLLGDGSTEVARELQEKYDEVYIDEYQDVNEIQDTIFKIIGQNRRFMVGDIKQSIYGFRDACPELFASYKSIFPPYDSECKSNSDGCTIFMSENFRCDENVISFANTVCSALFKANAESVGYTEKDDLVFKKSTPSGYVSPKVKIDIFDGKEEDSNSSDDTSEKSAISELLDEADFCAREILRLIKTEKKPDGSPVKLSDIAVLVRVKRHAPTVASALKKYGIEYCMSATNQLFDGQDMKAILDLLRVIDNPEDDISMCGFLTNTAYSGECLLSLQEVLTVRRASDTNYSLNRALLEYSDTSDPLSTLLSHRVSKILGMLSSLRELSKRVSADKLLLALKTFTEFKLICESQAYIYLYDCACNYVKRSWNGLYSFLKYYRRLSEGGSVTLNEASSTNAVNIMTTHQSKGLEYHAVFLFGCSRKFSVADSRKSLVYSRHLCAASKLKIEDSDEDGNLYINGTKESLIRSAVASCNYKESVYEEMRILYVALTRARERLYITATLKDYEDTCAKLAMMGDSKSAIMAQNSFISWILSALQNDTSNSDSYDITVHTLGYADEEDSISESSDEEIYATDTENEYVRLLSHERADKQIDDILSYIPSKIAASKASSDLLDTSLDIYRSHDLNNDATAHALQERAALMKSGAASSFDALLSEKSKPTYADIGTATHSFLQFCDLQNAANAGIDDEIKRLVDQRFITRAAADMIDRSQIEMFFNSDLFAMIEKASCIRREFQFGLFREAREFTQSKELSDILGDKKIYVQGSVDMLLEFKDGRIYICDYKTDRLTREERNDISLFKKRLISAHKDQLLQYKYAIESIFGRTPDKILIYSLPIGKCVELTEL